MCLSYVLTASEAGAVGCKCVHGVVWMMEWTHFMTNWKGKIQQAVTAHGWDSRCSQSTSLWLEIDKNVIERAGRGEGGQVLSFEFFHEPAITLKLCEEIWRLQTPKVNWPNKWFNHSAVTKQQCWLSKYPSLSGSVAQSVSSAWCYNLGCYGNSPHKHKCPHTTQEWEEENCPKKTNIL